MAEAEGHDAAATLRRVFEVVERMGEWWMMVTEGTMARQHRPRALHRQRLAQQLRPKVMAVPWALGHPQFQVVLSHGRVSNLQLLAVAAVQYESQMALRQVVPCRSGSASLAIDSQEVTNAYDAKPLRLRSAWIHQTVDDSAEAVAAYAVVKGIDRCQSQW